MDRNYYYQKLARARQHEISQELSNRHLLNESRSTLPGAKRVKRLVWVGAPALIAFTILLLIHFFI
jgi:hypothetical protein